MAMAVLKGSISPDLLKSAGALSKVCFWKLQCLRAKSAVSVSGPWMGVIGRERVRHGGKNDVAPRHA